MSQFINQERAAAVLAESRRILEDKPPPAPAPAPEPRPIVFEDDMDRHRREAREFDERRAAAKAELRRKQDDSALAGFAAIGARLDSIEQRLDEVERTVSSLYEVAPAAAEFSNSVVGRMEQIETLTTRLSATLDTLRMIQDQQTKVLRDRLAAAESAHARESAFQARQLAESRREIDALTNHLARQQDQEQTNTKLTRIAENVDNVVTYMIHKRDPAA